jgi:hypothetical protein
LKALAWFIVLFAAYVKLGITLGGLVEVRLLDLGGVETARGSAEKGLAGQSPAGS